MEVGQNERNEVARKYNLHVVYFINCVVNPNYSDWLQPQLGYVTSQISDSNIRDVAVHFVSQLWSQLGYVTSQISDSNIRDVAVYVVAVIAKTNQDEFADKLRTLFPKQAFKVEFFEENEYEYRGISRVWEIGQSHKDKNDIILYYHSKGVTRHASYEDNKDDRYNAVLEDIDGVLRIFDKHSEVDKVGYSCGGVGWVWYNFWYARGSYISEVEKPIKTTRRHYYEDWLGRKVGAGGTSICDEERPHSFYENTLGDCYSLHTHENVPNMGFHYVPGDNTYRRNESTPC